MGQREKGGGWEGLDARANPTNIEQAMAFIEKHFQPGEPLTEQFIRELHALTVRDLDLQRKGDATPGAYRKNRVLIAQAEHLPPEGIQVPPYMQELVAFINANDAPKYDLMKVALAHHRFGWIHPFSNGNGRVVRLLTYALLIKYGFNVKTGGGRVLNPTAVFCNDRDQYYARLGAADQGTQQALESWCGYVLQGILVELRKVDHLTDFTYLRERILGPALTYARDRQLITAQEEKILRLAVQAGMAKAADLAVSMPGLNATQRTYQIKKLVERKMLQPLAEGSRQYSIGFINNYLLRGVINALSAEGFISASLDTEPAESRINS